MAKSAAKRPGSVPRKASVIIATITLLLIVLMVGGYIALSLGFSGGYAQWKLSRQPKPNFNSAYFTGLRSSTQKQLDSSYNDIPTATFDPIKTESSNVCAAGIHNWVNTDSFAYQCTMYENRYYGFSGDFKTKLMGLDATLKAQGWTTTASDILSVLATYYDTAYKGPGSSYPLVDVPAASYSKGDLGISLHWAERGDENGDVTLFSQSGQTKTILQQTFNHDGYAMVAETSKLYYQK